MAAASTTNASGQTLIGASGTVYVGTPGATVTAPTDEAASVDADLVTVGFISEDGIKFRDSKDVGALKAWQTAYDVRRFVTGRNFELEFSMEQWNWHTLPTALGGGTVTIPTAGHYKYVPPDSDDLDPRALVVDWVDGTRVYRLWVPQAIVTSQVEVNVKRDEGAMFPVTFGAIFDGTNPAFTIFTDDAAFQNV
jgi:hypothetical protein